MQWFVREVVNLIIEYNTTFKKKLEDIGPFCGACNISLLDFLWRLPWF